MVIIISKKKKTKHTHSLNNKTPKIKKKAQKKLKIKSL